MDEIERVQSIAAKAALDPRYWPDVLVGLGSLVGSDMSVIERIDKRSGRSECLFTDRPGILAETREPFEQHYCKISPRHDLARMLPAATLLHDDLVGDERALGRYEFYVDFLKAYGLRYFIGSALTESPDERIVISFQRAANRGRVTREERTAFDALLPALRNAMAIHARRLVLPFEATLAMALDQLIDPLAVIGKQARLIFANRAMRGTMEAGDIVVQRGTRLQGVREEIRRALHRAMRQAQRDGTAAEAVASSTCMLAPLILRVVRLAPEDAQQFLLSDEALFCLFIDDPAHPRWAAVGDAMKLYGLTRREAEVGGHLAAGLKIDEIAGKLGISRNTVRFHLSGVRDKLGLRSTSAVAAELRRAIPRFEKQTGFQSR